MAFNGITKCEWIGIARGGLGAIDTGAPSGRRQGGNAGGAIQYAKNGCAAQAALKEASETPAQTASEAGEGDLTAKRLLAKESASRR